MKNKLFVSFSILLIPLSILAQKEVQTSKIDDSTYVVNFSYEDGDMSYGKITSKDSLRADSLKGSLHFQDLVAREKRRRFKRDSTLKALTNTPIPDFEAPDTAGFKHHPAYYRGRVLVLHFWNFWDFSFDTEIPILNKLVEKYRKDGLEILSFVDIKLGESEKRMLRAKPVNFPLIPNSWQFSDNFLSIGKSKPYIILIDKRGYFHHFYINNDFSKFRKNKEQQDKMVENFELKIQSLLRE